MPATGSAEALDALAFLFRQVPDVFSDIEADLDPRRLAALADRQRALEVLDQFPHRLSDWPDDFSHKVGDEIAGLLSAGAARAYALALVQQEEGPIAWAVGVLCRYQQRAQVMASLPAPPPARPADCRRC